MGATIANHTEVLSLIKGNDENGNEVVKGARMRDCITGKEQGCALFIDC